MQSPDGGAESALCALVLSALPIVRVGVANLIRAEFGREVRILSADWAAQHEVFESRASFHLVVAHCTGEVLADDLSRLAALAQGAALVVVRPQPGPLRRAPQFPSNLRWIAIDAVPEDWRRAMRASLFHARRDGGIALGAAAGRRPVIMPPRAGARRLPQGVAPGLLTRRQIDVFDMLGAGLSNKTIAEQLDLSVGTVKLHVAAILRALNAKRRVDIVLRRAGVQPQLPEGRLGNPDELAD
jgi:DNA-binding CsgD family transcriptional regulator